MVSVRYFAVTDDVGNKVGLFRERKGEEGYWLEGQARDGSWYDDPSLARYLWGGEGGVEEMPPPEKEKLQEWSRSKQNLE